MNKSCNVLNRKRKNKNRDHMLIEKFLGLYDPECEVDYPVEGIVFLCEFRFLLLVQEFVGFVALKSSHLMCRKRRICELLKI